MSEKLISWLKVNGYDMKNIWWGGEGYSFSHIMRGQS